MKVLFATLLCHRDIQYFLLNWFTMRAYLDRGFEIPHLVLNDGSLTEEDFKELEKLPLCYVEKGPVFQYPDVPKAIYLAKLECFKVGFEKYNADRVVIFDCDVFFFRNWDPDLRKIYGSPSIALRDWGSSLGPNVEQVKQMCGVFEDVITPNCNTGLYSTIKAEYYKLEKTIQVYVKNKIMAMEDQFCFFAAYYGQLDYINGVVCAVAGGENVPEIKKWWFDQNACHLMGMRTRPVATKEMIQLSLQNLSESLSLEQFPPEQKHISFGLMEYGTYCYQAPLQYYPSSYNGKYICDALYLHGGSFAKWKLPPRCQKFTAKLVCMDTGIPTNCASVTINGQRYDLEANLEIPLNGNLEIRTPDGPGTHFAFLSPKVFLDRTIPDPLSTNV